jgi:hypothetical protein
VDNNRLNLLKEEGDFPIKGSFHRFYQPSRGMPLVQNPIIGYNDNKLA